MIGFDTNIPVRYIEQDDAKQSALANRLFDSPKARRPEVVLPCHAGSKEQPGFHVAIRVASVEWRLCTGEVQ
jgi:hypothetical protein